jgi:hypothetical protein
VTRLKRLLTGLANLIFVDVSPSSIAFNMLPPAQLDELLVAAGLRRKWSLFSDKTFSCLYECLATQAEDGFEDGASRESRTVSLNLLSDLISFLIY